MEIDLKDCSTVLQFLDKIAGVLKVSNYFSFNLERLSGLLSSLDKNGFKFPLTLKFSNIDGYRNKCPRGWEIFVVSLENARKEYQKRGLKFDYEFSEEEN